MIPDTEIMARLERLERDNRRLKRLGAAAVALAAALALVAATRPVPDVIEAHKFLLVDKSSKPRAWLDVIPDQSSGRTMGGTHAELVLAWSDGNQSICLHGERGYSANAGISGKSVPLAVSPGLDIFSGSTNEGHILSLADSGISVMTMEVLGKHVISSTTLGTGGIEISAPEPSLILEDDDGFKMYLGSTETVNPKIGQTKKTSAASIVMFGNDKKHHVIWEAP